MDTQEQLDRLTGIVDALASSVVHHDNQIGDLIQVARKHQDEMAEINKKMLELREEHARTQRLLEAYLKRLPPQ